MLPVFSQEFASYTKFCGAQDRQVEVRVVLLHMLLLVPTLQQFMTMLSSSFGLQECKVLHGTHVSTGGNFVLRWLGCMHVQCAIVYAHKCHV